MTPPVFDNHFEVHSKSAFKHALLAGAYPTYEEARKNPFSIHLAGTTLKYSFPKGLHERDAARMVRGMHRIPAKVFSPN